MKILSATVFLSLGMAIGTAISTVAGANAANAAGPGLGMGEATFVEPQPLLVAEVEQLPVQIVDGQLPAEVGGAH